MLAIYFVTIKFVSLFLAWPPLLRLQGFSTFNFALSVSALNFPTIDSYIAFSRYFVFHIPRTIFFFKHTYILYVHLYYKSWISYHWRQKLINLGNLANLQSGTKEIFESKHPCSHQRILKTEVVSPKTIFQKLNCRVRQYFSCAMKVECSALDTKDPSSPLFHFLPRKYLLFGAFPVVNCQS